MNHSFFSYRVHRQTHRHTPRQTDRHTDGHEYSIVAVDNNCVNCCNNHVSNITVVDVLHGVDKLKYRKSDAIEDILTDNIIHGSHRLYVLLAILFTSMNNHGKSPKNMLYGTIIPIPKVKGTTGKYHAITKSSVLLKLLEYIFLNKCNDDLCIADLQYGITKGVSTTSCTFIVQKVI